MKRTVGITSEYDGFCVRDYVRSILGFSSRAFKDAKYHGSITVNDIPVFANCILHTGDVLCLQVAEAGSASVEPRDIPISVLYEDEDYLFVDKPAGMPAHPSFNHKDATLANAVMFYYRDVPFTFRLLTRLDADTTGVAVIAKNAFAAGAFLSCNPQKTYYAFCECRPDPPCGTIDAPIGRAPDSIIKRIVCSDGKPSRTEYEFVAAYGALSLVRVIPLTGRTHQIRLHLSHIGCPLYGDFLYGTEIPGERTRLHCGALSFLHPVSGRYLEVSAPLPEDFRRLM